LPNSFCGASAVGAVSSAVANFFWTMTVPSSFVPKLCLG
jgi:hypothetical protein